MSLNEVIAAIAKEGADLTGIEGQLKNYVNLAELPKEQVWDTIKAHPSLMSVFDSEVSKRVNTGVENFRNDKMPDYISQAVREKEEALRKELAPEETPEQKRIRELEEKILAAENEKGITALQNDLAAKAKELGFDSEKARDYAVYGENAMAKLESDAAWFAEEINKRLDSEIKNKYKSGPPKRSEIDPADIDTKIKEARAAGNNDLALKLQMIKDRQKQTA